MNARMLRRADEMAREARTRRVRAVAQRLSELLENASITVEESQVIVSGRGLMNRWLSDPRLRFYGVTK